MDEPKRFASYDEAMAYLSNIFNKAGYWQVNLSWSERTEFEERPYKLILEQPTSKILKGISEAFREA